MSLTFSNLIGGSPVAVIVRLLVISFVAGLVLVTFGFEPETLYEMAYRGVRRLIEYGLGDMRQLLRIFITGAMVVFPVWVILRLLDARRAR